MKKCLTIVLLGWNVLAFGGGGPSHVEEPELSRDKDNTKAEGKEEESFPINPGKQEEELDNREKVRAVAARILQSHPRSPGRTYDTEEDEFPINDFRHIPTEKEMELYQIVLDGAPKEAHCVLLKEQNLRDHPLRVNRLLLVGEPGTGKSTLAKAMGCRMGECYFVIPGPLLCKHRNGASEKVTALMKSIIKKNCRVVLIIDEVNKLTDNYASESTDSSQTAAVLWTYLDAQEQNPNFFLICTTNESKKLPPPLQSRFESAAIKISYPKNFFRKKIIKSFLEKVRCSSDINDQYIDTFVECTKDLSIRCIKQRVWSAIGYDEDFEVTKDILERKFKEEKIKGEELWDFSEAVPDEERRHRESMQLQKDFQEEQKEMQSKSHKLQRKMYENQIDQENTQKIQALWSWARS